MIAATFPRGVERSEYAMTRTDGLSLCFLVFGCALNSCLAADRILFDRLGPTQAALFISDADGSTERPLTQPGGYWTPLRTKPPRLPPDKAMISALPDLPRLMDCFLLGSRSRRRPSSCQRSLGTPESGRHLSHPSQRQRSQTDLSARRLLRQPQMDPR